MLHSHFEDLALQPFIEKMDKECYDKIERLCQGSIKQTQKLNELEVNHLSSQYVPLCSKLIEEIMGYIKFRKEQLIPYVQKLNEKEADGHDCSNCTGGACKMGHDLLLMELKESHLKIKDTLYRLQMAVLPLYSETMYPDAYRILRNQMALLENNLTELSFLEGIYLLPKVIEAQKNIHVRS